ncbi:MAG: hypothetical protein FJ313_06490 [Gemmatimonadetes bacterium]|nr:hypothetical protein [Gemmatimonadota bacterium]
MLRPRRITGRLRAAGRFLGAAALAAALTAGVLAEEKAPPPTRVPTRGESAKPEAFRLPPDYKNADGSFNQEALVAQQRKRLEPINEKLLGKFEMAETAHYLIVSDADPQISQTFVKWAEALYSNLCSQFGIDPKERVWDGKCMLLLFSTRRKFQQYSLEFDGHDAGMAGAYFAWEANSAREPQLVHICIPLDEKDPRRLQDLFAHEGTHAFFQLYKRPVDLPLWLHEGLAEYMTVVNDPGLRPQKAGYALQVASSGASIERVLRSTTGMPLSIMDYSVSYTLVDCLVKAGKPKFKQYIALLKEGKDQVTALKTAYGCDLFGLEQRWRAWMKMNETAYRRR